MTAPLNINLDTIAGDEVEISADNGEVYVRIRFTGELCPYCGCGWLDWHERYLCGYQPGRGKRSRHFCDVTRAWGYRP